MFLSCRLSIDRRVLGQMKERTVGNSSSQLRAYLVEHHTAEWMRQSNLFQHTYDKFVVSGVQVPALPLLPKMEPVPTSGWLLDTYTRESFSRIDELRAKVTSTFGSILKLDSTKKVRSLQLITC